MAIEPGTDETYDVVDTNQNADDDWNLESAICVDEAEKEAVKLWLYINRLRGDLTYQSV